MSRRALQISNLSSASPEQINALLQDSSFKPMRYLGNRVEGDLTQLWLTSLIESLADGNVRGLLARQDETPLGLLVYSENTWETEVIGIKAGTLNHFVVAPHAAQAQVATSLLDTALQQASSAGFGMLLGRAHSDDYVNIHALESAGFLLMDTVVDCFHDFLRMPPASAPVVGSDIILRRATSADRSELVSLAQLAFKGHFGRFHADDRMGRDVATHVYERWLSSSIDGYADWVDVAEISGNIAGFSVWKKPAPRELAQNIRVGHYSISGIHPAYHGRGLFTTLTAAGMNEMKAFADIVEGPTHINNYGVHAGYSKLNWRVFADARHSFHKWIR